MSSSPGALGKTPRGPSETSEASTAVMGTYARQDIVFARGEGLMARSPNRATAISISDPASPSTRLGHAHPRLVEALTAQAEKLWHTSNLYRVDRSGNAGREV